MNALIYFRIVFLGDGIRNYVITVLAILRLWRAISLWGRKIIARIIMTSFNFISLIV